MTDLIVSQLRKNRSWKRTGTIFNLQEPPPYQAPVIQKRPQVRRESLNEEAKRFLDRKKRRRSARAFCWPGNDRERTIEASAAN